jgi:hypothetical protein
MKMSEALELLVGHLQGRGKTGEECLWKIPPHMHNALALYVMKGISGGSFLSALMSNDFMEAVLRADNKNQAALIDWARLIYNDLPVGCSGSPEKVKKWIEKGGLMGRKDEA